MTALKLGCAKIKGDQNQEVRENERLKVHLHVF